MDAMRQLLPRTDSATPVDDDTLARLYAMPAPASAAHVRANFVSTLDGAVQGPDHRSGTINSEADTMVFALQRALADVVLVGAGTARTEGYGPASIRPKFARFRPEGADPTPPIAVVTNSLRLSEQLLIDPRTIVITSQASPLRRREELAERIDLVVVGRDRVAAGDVVAALTDRGHRRLLCEGGPQLTAQLAAADALDELCLTLAPLLRAGAAERVLAGPELAQMTQWTPASLLIDDEGFLLGRWVRARPAE
jgi:riboflavin biosynthesis pyrimidine reductase